MGLKMPRRRDEASAKQRALHKNITAITVMNCKDHDALQARKAILCGNKGVFVNAEARSGAGRKTSIKKRKLSMT